MQNLSVLAVLLSTVLWGQFKDVERIAKHHLLKWMPLRSAVLNPLPPSDSCSTGLAFHQGILPTRWSILLNYFGDCSAFNKTTQSFPWNVSDCCDSSLEHGALLSNPWGVLSVHLWSQEESRIGLPCLDSSRVGSHHWIFNQLKELQIAELMSFCPLSSSSAVAGGEPYTDHVLKV